jgi:hypothetical protein
MIIFCLGRDFQQVFFADVRAIQVVGGVERGGVELIYEKKDAGIFQHLRDRGSGDSRGGPSTIHQGKLYAL